MQKGPNGISCKMGHMTCHVKRAMDFAGGQFKIDPLPFTQPSNIVHHNYMYR